MICDNNNPPFQLLIFESKYSKIQQMKLHLYLWSYDQVPVYVNYELSWVFLFVEFKKDLCK